MPSRPAAAGLPSDAPGGRSRGEVDGYRPCIPLPKLRAPGPLRTGGLACHQAGCGGRLVHTKPQGWRQCLPAPSVLPEPATRGMKRSLKHQKPTMQVSPSSRPVSGPDAIPRIWVARRRSRGAAVPGSQDVVVGGGRRPHVFLHSKTSGAVARHNEGGPPQGVFAQATLASI
jgi:hypothetical protein